ncbi:PHD finger domain protein, putative [Rhizophagus clarus]|uniref:Histone H1 n=1 Tax=Rhizophagus clarus TaxID=94130 RepID=A0A8H3R3K5_9GLOM|nr:PHD finger domain protein, putative [Rhizophagus clarus]
MNNLENQATDVNNNVRSSDDSNEASPSNVNNVINNQNNQDMSKWGEEDGDFEYDEAIQQQGGRHETQPPSSSPPQQPVQLSENSGFDFDNNMVNSGQISSLNDDDQTTNDIVGGEKQNNEVVEVSQSSTTNINNDDAVHFKEDLDDMMTDEIEDEISKSQSPEKVQKSKQSPQKGKQKKGARKSKTDAELSATEGTKATPIKNNNDQDDDQNDPLDSDNDPKTKSGRKIQKPEYFNPTNFGRGRRRSSFEPLSNEPSRRTKRQGKRRKSKGKDIIVSQESENIFSDPNNPPGIFMDAEEDNIVCTICRDGSSAKQNWIVFCDKCDAPYHQLCHKPRIDDDVVEDSQTEWICSKCKISPRSNKRIKVDNKSPEIQEFNEIRGQGQDLISIGTVLTREQKVEYLSSLSQDVLVNLLLLAEQIEPNIPLYPANILGKYAAVNMSSKDNEIVETNQNAGELIVDIQTSELPDAETSNLSTLNTSPNLNPVNIDYVPSQVPRQDTQQEPITPEASPPLGGLKEIAEHSKDSYLSLYIKAMSEIGNPNGSTAMTMHSWIKSNYNVPENFAARAKKALNYAVSKGIFIKNSRMTYKFNPDCTIPYNKDLDDGNEHTAEEVKNIGVNLNNNEYDGQKELTSEEEIPGEDTYTATTQSQRSSLSNPVAESNNNPITDQYASSDKPPPSTTQSQPVSKLPMNAQILVENEQTLRLPPLAPKPPISVLPSIVRSNYQPSQTELLSSSIGGVIRSNQPQPQSQPQPPQQLYDNTKIRTSSSSIPSLQPLPTIDTSLNGNVNKIRQQMIPLQTSTMHNTPTSIPTSPQQTWPSSFNPFYMSPQPGDTQYTTIFENTFYDPATQSTQHQHHTSTASTNDYNNAVLNDLQQHNDNGSLFHRMNGSQHDNNIIGEWEYRSM